MKLSIKNTILILTTAILLPLSLVRVVSKNIVEEAKAFSDGFISQQKIAEVEVEENVEIIQPKDITPTPVIEIVKQPVIEVINDTEYIKKRICEVFGEQCQNALIIAKHESGFTTHKVSKTNDYGLFQLNCRWQGKRVGGDCTKFFDLETNLRVAKQIYNEQGWNPWTTKVFLK